MRLAVWCIGIGLIAAVGCGDGGDEASDEEQVRDVVEEFVVAVDSGDEATACGQLTERFWTTNSPGSETCEDAIDTQGIDVSGAEVGTVTIESDDEAVVHLTDETELQLERSDDTWLIDDID